MDSENEHNETREELADEVIRLRQRVAELEESEKKLKKTEEILRQTEKKYHNIFQNAMEGIYQTTPDGRYLTANPALAHIYGYDSPEELIGNITSIGEQQYVKPALRKKFIDIMEEKGEVKGFEIEIRRKNGGTIWVSTNAKALKDSSGKTLYYEGTSVDITERVWAVEEMKKSELRYRGLVESSPDAIILVENKIILYFNPSAARLLGSVRTREILGRNILDFFHHDDREIVVNGIESVPGTGILSLKKEVRLVRNDGEIVFVACSGSSIRYDELTLLQMVMRDITRRVHMEELLNKTRYQQKAILDNIPDIAWLKDKDSVYILANQPFGESCGVKQEDLPGKTDYDLWPHDLAEKYRQDDRKVIESGKYRQIEESLQDIDGKLHAMETIKTPIVNEKGAVIGTAGISRDITVRKKQEEELWLYQEKLERLVEERTVELLKTNSLLEKELSERQRTEDVLWLTQFSVDRSADPIFWATPNAHLLYVNDITCKMLGYARHELLTMTIYDIDPNFSSHIWLEHIEELKNHGSLTFESMHCKKEGTAYPVEITANYLSHRGNAYIFYFIRDITERRRTEEKVRELNQELEARILELKSINKELETFNYSVSHDLRTPLIAIEGFSRIVMEKYGNNLDEKGQHILSMINKNANRMGELIEDLLKFFSIGRKNIRFMLIDMEKMANDIAADFKSLYPEDAFRIEFDSIPPAHGDRKMVRQVLINLVTNAIKYSRPKGCAFITIGGRTVGNKNVYFVKDNGIGFPTEQADKAFDVFERLHGADDIEGTGLGLAIVKRIIQKHGGEVWAEATPGKGAAFFFSLPERLR